MAQKTQAIQTRLGVTVNAKSLTVLEKNAKFEPIIGKPGDGASPSLALIDEFHEHPDDTLLDCMVTGMGAREQPLAAIFTTAGDNISGPCYAMQSDVQKMLEGSLSRDDLFGIVYTIDDDDDCFTEASLRKANPNYGVSVFPEFLLAQQCEALQTARKQGIFKTKHLNVWVTARSGFFNLQRWNDCTDSTLRIEDFANDNCIMGLDLASVNDIAAVILLFRRIVAGVEHYYAFGRYYLPSERVEMPENRHYQGWAADGTLVTTDGAMIDYGVIKADILKLCFEHPQVQEIAFDARYAYLLMQELHDATGITPVTIPQKTEFMSPAMKLLDGLILSGRIHHNGDPALTWMLSNVVAKEDANENVYPRKERDENKIDGVTALLNALARASVLPMAYPTVYESSGVFFL
jgi:phage terminase large subunit-like protein